MEMDHPQYPLAFQLTVCQYSVESTALQRNQPVEASLLVRPELYPRRQQKRSAGQGLSCSFCTQFQRLNGSQTLVGVFSLDPLRVCCRIILVIWEFALSIRVLACASCGLRSARSLGSPSPIASQSARACSASASSWASIRRALARSAVRVATLTS